MMTLPAWMLQHLSGACQRLTHTLQPFQGLSMALCLAVADRLAWLQMAGAGVSRFFQ